MVKTKKVRAAGRFGARYGKTIRNRVSAVEDKQRKKQKCPHCNKLGVKRNSKGIWECSKCNKIFAENAYYIN